MNLDLYSYATIHTPPAPPPPPPPSSLSVDFNTHVELFPKFRPQNKFFDNHEYSRRSLKLLLFLDSGVWRNLSFRALTAARHKRYRVPYPMTVHILTAACRIRIYDVYGQPLLQWSTTESQGLIQKFPCTICTSRSIQRKNIHFDFGKTNNL